MKAKELFELHKDEFFKNKNYISIHKTGEKQIWYNINKHDEKVKRFSIESGVMMSCQWSSLNNMMGDDFELFSAQQVLLCGYLIFEKPVDIVSKLNLFSDMVMYHRGLISSARLEKISVDEDTEINGCQIFDKGITIDIRRISYFVQQNICLKELKQYCYPYIKSMGDENTLRIDLSGAITVSTFKKDTAQDRLHVILKGLDRYGIKTKWVECKFSHPIYIFE